MDPVDGRSMFVVWQKLRNLQPVIQQMQKKFYGVRDTLEQARARLKTAQEYLLADRMNVNLIEQVKHCTTDVLHWNDMEELLLQQQSKIDWIRLGDGNNSYFHATVKEKNRNSGMNCIKKKK